jgi:GTP pyrophosphokinase
MPIGEEILRLRKRNDMTQADLAARLYVTAQAVSQWERGVTLPDTAKLSDIAAALGVGVNALTGGSVPAPEWTVRDSLFSPEHMYSRMKVFAEAERLSDTQKALPFMRKAHSGQTRKPSFFSDAAVPYVVHPLLMACHAHALGIREDAILAAILLHDVPEDCGVAPQELPCSEAVTEAVRVLTFPDVPYPDRHGVKSRYYGAVAQNRIACIVKLFDRCSNVSTMASAFNRQMLISYIDETETFVLPLIERARETAPEYVDAIFAVQYHMRSILESLKAMVLRDGAP